LGQSHCRVWVTSDKTHIEHNESGVNPIAAVPSDMDFRRNGPISDSRTAAQIIPFDHLNGGRE
jgi:hypothetical protein